MKNVLLSIPLHRTGGIASWGQKYYQTYHNPDIKLIAVDNAPNRSDKAGLLERIASGLFATRRVLISIKEQCKKNKIDIIHTTTSGSIGAFRDYLIGRYSKNHGIKSILHCHYGNIPLVLKKRNFISWLIYKSINQYDQVWVLDRATASFLKNSRSVSADVKLTPNSIEVRPNLILKPKSYKNVGFIANLVPDKGLFELILAIKKLQNDVVLHIVGDGSIDVVKRMKEIIGNDLGNRIKWYGRLNNDEAIAFMDKIDILALPTYMGAEAFPISILEAMSLGKLVISTKRAAIPDILTALDGSPCGILVKERSVEDIANAIDWCITNNSIADSICIKAYEKVYHCYRTDIVYDSYLDNYKELLRK